MTRLLLLAWLCLGSAVFGQEFSLLDDPPKDEKVEVPEVKEPVPEAKEESEKALLLPTPEMIENVKKSKGKPEKTNFSLMGEDVPGSNPDYFRLDTKSGTFLVVPSNGVDFRIDGFPYKQSLVAKEPEGKTEIVDSSIPKTEELKTSSYQEAHVASMTDKRPLITIAVKTGCEDETEIVNGYMETLSALGADEYFHFAVIDSDNSNYGNVVRDPNKLQIIVWWYKNGGWLRRAYLGSAEARLVFEKIKDWSIEYKDGGLLDARVDFSRN